MAECIDIHNHIVPENFPAYAGKGKDVPWPSMAEAHACHKHVMISGKLYRTVSDGSWSVPRRIEDMGKMQVTRQAISPMPELLSYWLPLEDAKVLIRYLNDEIARMISLAPDRFVGLGAVPLQDMDSALRELEHCVKVLKFSGVEIASHVNGVSIGDARFEPFFAEAERIGASIFVHALRPAGMERIVGKFSEQAVLFPGDIATAAASMVTGGIGARHPKLRIAFSHGGGAFPILLPRLVQAWNKVQASKESLPETPATTAKRWYFDCLVFDPKAIRFVVETYGDKQVCIGTDYPYAMGDDHPVTALEKCGFAPGVQEQIKATNARRFLGI
jgi:aminocarboxymuconate-semialdehyde decarboxylase